MAYATIDRDTTVHRSRVVGLPVVHFEGRFYPHREFVVTVSNPQAWAGAGIVLDRERQWLFYEYLSWNKVLAYCDKHGLYFDEIDYKDPDAYSLAQMVYRITELHGFDAFK